MTVSQGQAVLRRSVYLLVVAFVLLVLTTSCATQSGAYPTLKQADILVFWEMTGFRNAAIWGRLTLGERERGNAAYSAYQAAFAQALRAVHGNLNAPAPDNVKNLANEAIRVLSSMPK